MTAEAHRQSTLRFWLAVVAALEAGDLIALVLGWTPGRAAVAGVGLGLGASAALAAVILMGTTRPIGRWLGVAISVVLVLSFLVPLAAFSWADPTQARIPDLTLSVTCTAAPDAQTVAADVTFSWHKLDLWPAGAAGSTGIDQLAVYAELPGWIDAELGMPPQPGGPMPPVSLQSMEPGPWVTSSMDPAAQTLDGRPVGGWITPTETGLDLAIGPVSGGGSGSAAVRIMNAALQVGGHYGLAWTFQRNPDYEPDTLSQDMLPIFVAEYDHLQRFTVEAFASCGNPSQAFPNRSAEWLQY